MHFALFLSVNHLYNKLSNKGWNILYMYIRFDQIRFVFTKTVNG